MRRSRILIEEVVGIVAPINGGGNQSSCDLRRASRIAVELAGRRRAAQGDGSGLSQAGRAAGLGVG